MNRLIFLGIVGLTLAVALGPAEARDPVFVYSVKFLCGLQTTPSGTAVLPLPQEPPVKPGNYATAVNIHNFHNRPLEFLKKAVVANPQGQPRGPVGTPVTEQLGPNEALEVDCSNIVGLLPTSTASPLPSFIKGFVEIVSRRELSVVSVYTAQSCTNPGTAPEQSCTKLGELTLDVVPQRPFVERAVGEN